MKWKLGIALFLVFCLAGFNQGWSADVNSAKTSSSSDNERQAADGSNSGGYGGTGSSGGYGLAPPTGGARVQGGFDQMVGGSNAGGYGGTGSSGGYGLTPPAGSKGEVQAGFPGQAPEQQVGSGLGQFNPGIPVPDAPQQAAPPQQQQPKGKGAQQAQGGGSNRAHPQQQDLSQVINGVWRVQFSNGAVIDMTWRYDPRRATFFDGEKECRVQVSGNTVQASGQNSYTGAPQVITIQFLSPNEAVGTLGVQRAPNLPNSAVYLQFRAMRIG